MLFWTILIIIFIIINLGAFSGCDHWSLYSYFLSHLFISFLIFNGFEGKKKKTFFFLSGMDTKIFIYSELLDGNLKIP
jgi:hypothetical protein